MITNSGRVLNLREDDQTDYNDDNVKDTSATRLSSYPFNEQVISPLDLKRSPTFRTISFVPNDNYEVIYPSPNPSPFQSFSFAFRTHSNVCTLLQFDFISLIIDVDGYLALVIRHQQAQRIVSSHQRQSINDGSFYTVHFDFNHRVLHAWIDPNNKISVKVPRSVFTVENFIFGPHNQFLGCIENVTYNEQMFSFRQLASHRQHCSTMHDDIDRLISFDATDRPLIIVNDHAEQFRLFSFIFATRESNCFLCSLADRTYENFITLSVRHQRVFVAYHDLEKERLEFFINSSVSDGYEHRIIIKLVNKRDLLVQLDEHILMKKIFNTLATHRIYFGQPDGFIGEQFNDLDQRGFLGCMSDIMLNDKSIVTFEHIQQVDRLTNACQFSKHTREYAGVPSESLLIDRC